MRAGNPVPLAVTVLPRRLVVGSKVNVRLGTVNVAEAVTPRSSVTSTVWVLAIRDENVTGITTEVTRLPELSRLMG